MRLMILLQLQYSFIGNIMLNEKKERRARQIIQYAEIKMMKGHSEEQALKMAEEQITTKEW